MSAMKPMTFVLRKDRSLFNVDPGIFWSSKDGRINICKQELNKRMPIPVRAKNLYVKVSQVKPKSLSNVLVFCVECHVWPALRNLIRINGHVMNMHHRTDLAINELIPGTYYASFEWS